MQYDALSKRYFSSNERYADLINGVVFGGEQVVSPEDLRDMDSQTGSWNLTEDEKKTKNRSRQSKEKYRDLIRKTAFGMNFAIVGIENQQEVHYLMPLRAMGYDVGEYERQAVLIRREVKKQKDLERAEFLSGFQKESRLQPCVTIVLFYGDNWDGSKDLHGLIDFTGIPEQFRAMVNNYTLNILEIKKLEHTEVFQTDVKQVFDFVRYSKDKNTLKELVEKDPAYENFAEDAFDMAVIHTGAEELLAMKNQYKEGGRLNMCQALKELIEDGKMEGREEGRASGKAEGVIELLSEIGYVSDTLKEKIMRQTDMKVLSKWLKLAARTSSIEEFENMM